MVFVRFLLLEEMFEKQSNLVRPDFPFRTQRHLSRVSDVRVSPDSGLRIRAEVVTMGCGAMTNEEFIAQFRDWRLQWKPTLAEIDDEVCCLSKLAQFMAPAPLSKATKAVLVDFQWEAQMRAQSRESRAKILSAVIAIDAFLGEIRRKRKTQ
jgi:hypothetical protein